jgi:hypothetical protein
MMMQQVVFAVTGNDLAVSMAVLQGQLEINHFEPAAASRLFDSLDLRTNGLSQASRDLAVMREPGPGIDIAEDLGDAHPRQHAVEPDCQGRGLGPEPRASFGLCRARRPRSRR